MSLTKKAQAYLALLTVATLLIVTSSGSGQRPQADATAPTATGKVIAFEGDKSLTVEVKKRGGQVEKVEFAIVKDRTKVELLGTTKAIEIGTEVRVWADKDNPKAAARSYSSVRPGSNPRGSGWATCAGNWSSIAGSGRVSWRSKNSVTAVTAPATATPAIPIAATFT